MCAARKLISSIVLCEPESLPPDSTPLRDIKGWDSLKHVLLVVQLEKRCERQLTADEIKGIVTVGDVAALIDSKNANA
jgi:acyl carrier protein